MATVFWDTFTEACKARGTTPSGVAKALGLSSGSPTAWKRGATPNAFTIAEISRFLDWKMERFYGTTEGMQDFLDTQGQKEKAPGEGANDDDVKFALFGTTEISDELFERVKQMARIAAEMEAREKGG